MKDLKNNEISETKYFTRNRQLNYRYRKLFEWLMDTIEDGDKDFVEKMIKIVEKWKIEYERKVGNAKRHLKEFEEQIERIKEKHDIK
jgi:hypothetical protein